MISAFLDFKEPLIYVNRATTTDEFKRFFIKPKEWQVIEWLQQIFEVFVKPSVKLQGQVYVTLSSALLYVY